MTSQKNTNHKRLINLIPIKIKTSYFFMYKTNKRLNPYL